MMQALGSLPHGEGTVYHTYPINTMVVDDARSNCISSPDTSNDLFAIFQEIFWLQHQKGEQTLNPSMDK